MLLSLAKGREQVFPIDFSQYLAHFSPGAVPPDPLSLAPAPSKGNTTTTNREPPDLVKHWTHAHLRSQIEKSSFYFAGRVLWRLRQLLTIPQRLTIPRLHSGESTDPKNTFWFIWALQNVLKQKNCSYVACSMTRILSRSNVFLSDRSER